MTTMKENLWSLAKKLSSSTLLRLLLSVVFLSMAYRDVNFLEVLENLQMVSPFTILIFTLLSVLITLVAAYRWSILLLNHHNMKIYLRVFSAALLGNFYGLFLPTAIGGDTVKWINLLDVVSSRKRLFFSVLADRLSGLIGVVLLGTASLGLSWDSLGGKLPYLTVLFVISLFVATFVGLLAIFLLPKLSFLSSVPRVRPILNFVYQERKQFFRAIILSCVSQGLTFFATWFLAVSLGMDITLSQIYIFAPLISLFLALPLSISGFGATEAVYVYFFSQAGVENSQILALTTFILVYRIFFSLLSWMVGTFLPLLMTQRLRLWRK